MKASRSIIGGVAAGALTILLFYGLYRWDKEVMLSLSVYWGSLLIYVIAILLVLLRIKSIEGGILPFRQAVQHGFITFLIANAIFFVFYYLLFTSDTSLIEIQYQQLKDYVDTLPKGDWGREQMEQTKLEDLKVTFTDTCLRYARGAIGGFFLSAALALLTRQER